MDKTAINMCFYSTVILMIWFTIAGGTPDLEVCNPRPSTDIPLLPKSYEAKFQVTRRRLNSTFFVTEVYDDTHRRGTITTYYDGGQNKVIYDNGGNQMVTTILNMLDTTECRVHKFVSCFNNIFLTYSNGKNTTRNIRIDGLLHYERDLVFHHMGATTVRNIPANHWSACFYNKDMSATFETNVYWSQESSAAPSGDHVVPLLIELKGNFAYEPEKYETVDDSYDIVWFKSNPQINDEMFEPPLDIYCTDDKIKQDFPSLGEAVSVDVEHIRESSQFTKQDIMYQNMWYNLNTKLLRLDYDSSNPEEIKQFETTELTSIRDYKIGVEYKMDRFRTTCFRSPLNIADAPSLESIFFENIKNYEYLGKYVIRDLLCDVWVGQKDDNSIVEWAFLDESWKEEEGNEVESRVPIQSLWYRRDGISGNTSRATKNFFSYRRDPRPGKENQFDVSPCFPDVARKHFQVAFFPDNPDSVKLEELIGNARSTIPNLIHVSALRVDQVEAELKPNTGLLYLEFTIFDRPFIFPDILPPNDEDVPLDVAEQNLRNAVRKNSFSLRVSLPGSQESQNLVALPDSLRALEGLKGPDEPPSVALPLHSDQSEIFRRLPSPFRQESAPASSNQQAEEDNMDKYNAGQLAGLAVGMFILGGTLGIIAMLLLLLHIDRSRGAQDGLRLCDQEATAASSPQDFSPVTETSVD